VSWKRTALVALVFVLLVAVYIWDHQRVERRKSQEEEEKRIFPWKAEDLTEVILERPQGRLRLARGDKEDWSLLEPVSAKADREELSKLLDGLLGAKKDRTIADEPSDLEAYGLSQPSYTLTLKGKTPPHERTLLLGAKNPTEVYHYAKIQGEKRVFLVSDVVRRDAEKPLLDLRDKKVLGFEPRDVERLTIEAGGQRVTLRKEGEKDWRIEGPETLKADSEAVESLLFRLSRLRAVEFEDDPEDLRSKGMDPPQKKLSLKLKDTSEEQTMLLGLEVEQGSTDGRKKRVWARVEGQNPLVQIESSQLGEIPSEADGWRSKVLMAFERDKVEKVVLRTPSRRLQLRKLAEGAWEMEEPERLPADSVKVSDLLWTIKDSRVERFPKREELGAIEWGESVLEANVWLQGREEPLRLEVGPESPGGGRYAKAQEQEGTVVVSSKLVEELDRFTPWELREKRFVGLDVSKVKRFLARWEGKEMEVVRKGEHDWELLKPQKEPVEGFKATSLLWTIREARFEEPPREGGEDLELGSHPPKFELLAFGEGKEPVVRFVIGGEIPDKSGSYLSWCDPAHRAYVVGGKLLEEIKRDIKALVPSFVEGR